MATYSIVGLGKLGASMAAAIASRGHDVVGVDVVDRPIEMLNEGRAPVRETDLQELITRNRARLRATRDFGDAVENSDITFVVVPTPSNNSGAFSVAYARAAFASLGDALAAKKRRHTVVLTSTVLPGSTRFVLIPELERHAGRRCGPELGVCYSPEFIALGSVIRDFLNPDFVLIGEVDASSGNDLESAYRSIIQNGAPVTRMSIENAELAKIAVNTYVTMKISFANMIADLCQRIPGGDVDIVTRALGLDRRIGSRYLTGALGYGGPCFPRDNQAMAYLARSLGTSAPLAEATDRTNRDWLKQVVAKLVSLGAPRAHVCVLGAAYKPTSPVTEESQALALAIALADAGANVRVFDPMVELGEFSRPLNEALAGADLIVIATPDPAWGLITSAEFATALRDATVVDCWRVLNPATVRTAGLRYIPLGHHNEDNGSDTGSIWAKHVAGTEEMVPQHADGRG